MFPRDNAEVSAPSHAESRPAPTISDHPFRSKPLPKIAKGAFDC